MRNNVFIALSLSLSFLLTSVVSPAQAQDADFEVGQARRVKEAKEIGKMVREDVEEKHFVKSLAKIKYEDVLKDPDNLELNYRYAQQQVADGNVLGAAGTLERILLIKPEFHKARLFYAVVLFRLDNLNEARSELERLKGLKMKDTLRDEINLYLNEIDKRQKKTKVTLRQTVGYQFDGNRNAAPSSKNRLFFGAPLGLMGSARRQRDSSFINVTDLEVRHDLGFQAGHELLASYTYYLGEQSKLDSLDIGSHSYELGGIYKGRWFDFTPTFSSGYVNLSGQTFLKAQALNLRADKEFKKGSVYAKFKLERQDYHRVSENLTAPRRKGNQFDYEIGGTRKLTQTMRARAKIGYVNKNAKSKINGYERLYFGLSHTWVLPNAHFVVNSVDAIFDYYDEVDITVVGRTRRDKNLRYKVSYGWVLRDLPLVGRKLPKFVQDMAMTNSFEYYRSLSTITNNTYRNFKYQSLLTKKIEF